MHVAGMAGLASDGGTGVGRCVRPPIYSLILVFVAPTFIDVLALPFITLAAASRAVREVHRTLYYSHAMQKLQGFGAR